MYNFTPKVGVNFYTNYNFYPEVEVDQQSFTFIQNVPTVNINGFEIGLSIYLRM